MLQTRSVTSRFPSFQVTWFQITSSNSLAFRSHDVCWSYHFCTGCTSRRVTQTGWLRGKLDIALSSSDRGRVSASCEVWWWKSASTWWLVHQILSSSGPAQRPEPQSTHPVNFSSAPNDFNPLLYAWRAALCRDWPHRDREAHHRLDGDNGDALAWSVAHWSPSCGSREVGRGVDNL